jgi:photosystem II stability/assembly factor-like uncharacterized protein
MPAPMSFFALSYSEPKRKIVVLATLDDLDETQAITVACIFDGKSWGAQNFRNLAGTAVYADNALWIPSKDGEIVRSEQGNITRDRLPDSGSLGRHLGQPNQIRKIDDRFYICGFAGQVYTGTGQRTWVHMDDGLAETEGTPKSIDLEDIGGTGPDDIYVVGSGGLIAHWNGKKWARVPPVTNKYLAAVRCFAPNNIVAVGDDGLFVESDGKKWWTEVIPGCEEVTLSDVEMFQNRIYVAAVGKLMVRNGSKWEEVKHGLDKKRTFFFKLTTGDGKLWALGQKRLNSFDGKAWTAHINPDNG